MCCFFGQPLCCAIYILLDYACDWPTRVTSMHFTSFIETTSYWCVHVFEQSESVPCILHLQTNFTPLICACHWLIWEYSIHLKAYFECANLRGTRFTHKYSYKDEMFLSMISYLYHWLLFSFCFFFLWWFCAVCSCFCFFLLPGKSNIWFEPISNKTKQLLDQFFGQINMHVWRHQKQLSLLSLKLQVLAHIR